MNTQTDGLDTLHKVRSAWHWFLVFVLAGMLLGTCTDASAEDDKRPEEWCTPGGEWCAPAEDMCMTDSACVEECRREGRLTEEECLDVLGPA